MSLFKPRLPSALIVIGAIGAAAAILWPSAEMRPVNASIDLTLGAITTVEFRAARSLGYEVGIEMDLDAARRLFPCTADPDSHSPPDQCRGGRLPVSLKLSLLENGVDKSELLNPNTATAGGSYVYAGERPTYIWNAASARLSRGQRYRLIITSETDGTAALPAHPRLVVEFSPIDNLGPLILRLIGLSGAIIISLVGATWLLVRYVLAQRRR